MATESVLAEILSEILGPEVATRLRTGLRVVAALHRPAIDGRASQAELAQAMMMVLFHHSLESVPVAKAYVVGQWSRGEKIMLDHGAIRTVSGLKQGTLPAGQGAFARFLAPLGFYEAATYPLPRLRMVGRSWRHRDYPEEVAQLFVSELDVRDFSPDFRQASARVLGASEDPLSPACLSALKGLEADGSLPVEGAASLVRALVSAFGCHHPPPVWSDVEILRAESPEMAWIATEGNTFNHAAARVSDLDRVVRTQSALGRPIKNRVERSATGRVAQAAFYAAEVRRRFSRPDGRLEERAVLGSFFEFISRESHPGGAGLDLAFDASNAEGIFKMTAGSSD